MVNETFKKVKIELNRRGVYPFGRHRGTGSSYLVTTREDGKTFTIRISDHKPSKHEKILAYDMFEGKKVFVDQADVSIHPGSKWTWKRAVSAVMKFHLEVP